MAAIKSKDTKPELRVRSMLHSLGLRFRLHRKDLPGKPDVLLPKHRFAIFVHGCFWHSHDCRYGKVVPATRREFWAEKRAATVRRDQKKIAELEASGWIVITVWECQTKSTEELRNTLIRVLPIAGLGSQAAPSALASHLTASKS